jgi:vacuolar-type H+-ATPase subunit I/STV1
MPFSVNIYRELDHLDAKTRKVIMTVLEEIEKSVSESIRREDFTEFKEILRELSQSHRNAELRLGEIESAIKELTLAQTKTEERVAKLEDAVTELVRAQTRMEERVGKLEGAITELALAQKRTEQRVEELAEAQRKTEISLNRLIEDHRKTREQLGGLSHTVGYVLEDRAYIFLPELLKRDFGVEIVEPLRRDYVKIGKNRYEEVNIIGKGRKNGTEVWIIGDSKTQLKKSDIDNFLLRVTKISKYIPERKILLTVTFQASPQVRDYAKERDIKIYFSYELQGARLYSG